MLGRVAVQRRLVDEDVIDTCRRCRRRRRRVVFQRRRRELVLRLLSAARLPRANGLDDLHG